MAVPVQLFESTEYMADWADWPYCGIGCDFGPQRITDLDRNQNPK